MCEFLHKNTFLNQTANFSNSVIAQLKVRYHPLMAMAPWLRTTVTNKLDRSLPANPLNDQRIANAVTLKNTFCLS